MDDVDVLGLDTVTVCFVNIAVQYHCILVQKDSSGVAK